jgi:alcohol dehydrogenase
MINAATGLVGAAGVLLALAMGAGRIVALGRKEPVLNELCALDPRRVSALKITRTADDAPAILDAVNGAADIMLDCVGDIPDPVSTQNALAALEPYGCALFVGGCFGDLAVNYEWMLDKQITMLGSSWYPRQGTAEMVGMIATGALDAEALRTRVFSLDEANDAVQWAEKGPGGLEHAALVP